MIYRGLKQHIEKGVIYNKFEENKLAFVNDVYTNNTTRECHFKKLTTFINEEKWLGKDLYQMSSEEIKEIIVNYPTCSARTIRNYLSIMRRYSQWAINKGLNPTGINSMNILERDNEIVNKMLMFGALKKKYVTREELQDICKVALDNHLDEQDLLIILLPFCGILGANYCEIKNMLKEDILEDSILVRNRNGEVYKKIEVEEWILNYIRKGAYLDGKSLIGLDRFVPYKESCYAIRSTKSGQATDTLIQSRCKKVMEFNNLSYSVNAKSLFHSGIYQLINDTLEKENRAEPNENDFKNACLKYGAGKSTWWKLKEDYKLIQKHKKKMATT